MPSPAVIAVLGPTAVGKSAVVRELLARVDAEAVSADSAALYQGLPILTATPDYPTHLTGCFPLSHDVSVGAYQRLAHAAIDEIVSTRRTAILAGGTGLYVRAALSALEFPPPPSPEARERWERRYERAGAARAHAELAARDPAAAARVHANDRRRVVRALELAEVGASLARAADGLWADDVRHPTLVVALSLPRGALDERIRQRTVAMAERGAAEEARRAWRSELSSTARKVLGLEAFATLPLDQAIEAVAAATRRLARYQEKWLRRLPNRATLEADRSPEELADDILALAGAGQRLSGR